MKIASKEQKKGQIEIVAQKKQKKKTTHFSNLTAVERPSPQVKKCGFTQLLEIVRT